MQYFHCEVRQNSLFYNVTYTKKSKQRHHVVRGGLYMQCGLSLHSVLGFEETGMF